MDGKDLQRRIAPITAGKATRASLEELRQRQEAANATTGEECRRLGRAGIYDAEEGTAALGPKLEAARRR